MRNRAVEKRAFLPKMGQTAPFETSQQILSGEESFRRGANLVLYALFFFFFSPKSISSFRFTLEYLRGHFEKSRGCVDECVRANVELIN